MERSAKHIEQQKGETQLASLGEAVHFLHVISASLYCRFEFQKFGIIGETNCREEMMPEAYTAFGCCISFFRALECLSSLRSWCSMLASSELLPAPIAHTEL